MTQDVRSKNTAPPDRRAGQDRPRVGPKTPALLILRQEVSQQDPLTRVQHCSRGPRDTMGGGVHRCCPPHRNDVASAHHLITPASVTGRLRSDLGKTPLTRSAVVTPWMSAQ